MENKEIPIVLKRECVRLETLESSIIEGMSNKASPRNINLSKSNTTQITDLRLFFTQRKRARWNGTIMKW